MAITAYTDTVTGYLHRVTVTSSLSGTIYYHWYLDGAWLGVTLDPSWTIYLDAGDTGEIVCQDTNDADYDYIANAPTGYPGRRSIWWNRSVDTDVASYRIEYGTGASLPASWTEAGSVAADSSWAGSFLSGLLTDLTWYWWRIVPVDEAGNDGTALVVGREYVVRLPSAPNVSVTFSDVTQKVTFAAAA